MTWGNIGCTNKLSDQSKMLSKSCHWNLKKKLFNVILYWLTNQLANRLPDAFRLVWLDKGLIFSVFNVASVQEVPFGIPQYIQCILQGLTSILLCVPFIFAESEKCDLVARRDVFLVKLSVFFIVATLVLYRYFSDSSWFMLLCNEFFFFLWWK